MPSVWSIAPSGGQAGAKFGPVNETMLAPPPSAAQSRFSCQSSWFALLLIVTVFTARS